MSPLANSQSHFESGNISVAFHSKNGSNENYECTCCGVTLVEEKLLTDITYLRYLGIVASFIQVDADVRSFNSSPIFVFKDTNVGIWYVVTKNVQHRVCGNKMSWVFISEVQMIKLFAHFKWNTKFAKYTRHSYGDDKR